LAVRKARRLAAAGTAACGGHRADVPSAAKQKLHYFPANAAQEDRTKATDANCRIFRTLNRVFMVQL